jgi:ATP-dependent Clp protease protease subunit
MMGGGGQQPSRLVYLSGDVTEESINIVQQQLLELANISIEPIHLIISTYGGEVYEMFSLCDIIRFLPCPVYTVAMGKVMSAGSLILSFGEKGHRLIGKSTRIMIHSLSGGARGNVFEMLNECEELKALQEMYIELLSQNTKLTKKQVIDMLSKKVNTYLNAEKCIELGLADKII